MQQAIDILKRSSLEVELAAKEGEVSLLVHMFLLSSVDRLLRAGTFLVFYRMTYVQCICIMWCYGDMSVCHKPVSCQKI